MEPFEKKYELTPEELKEILQKTHKTVEILEISHTPLNVMGIMGGHFNLTAQYRTNEKIYHKLFFQKRMITRYKIQDKMIIAQKAFQKEKFIYETFSNGFVKKIMPELFYMKEDLYFVFDHLGENGFKTRPGDTFLYDMNHLKLALEATATFHAGSIIFENRIKKSLVEEFPEVFNEPIYIRDENYLGNKLFTSGTQTILELIKISPGFSENFEETKEIVLGHVDNVYNVVGTSKKFLNVMNHGDLWDKNILFKYDNEVPVDVKLVDFQSLRYTIPAHDVLNLIHSVTTLNFRNKFLDDLLLHYYTSLSNCLCQNALNVVDYMTFDSFKESVEYIFPFVLIQKLIFFLSVVFFTNPKIQNDEKLFEEFLYGDLSTEVCVREYEKKGMFYHTFNEYLSEIRKLKPVEKL